MTCLHCGSPNVRWVEGEGPTGVSAPDGYAEMQAQDGWECADCGAIEVSTTGFRAADHERFLTTDQGRAFLHRLRQKGFR